MRNWILRVAVIIWMLGCLAFYSLTSVNFPRMKGRLIGASVRAEMIQLSEAARSIVQRKDIWQ